MRERNYKFHNNRNNKIKIHSLVVISGMATMVMAMERKSNIVWLRIPN